MGDPAGPSQSGSNTQSNRKRGRGRTRMKNLKMKTAHGEKLPIEFQSNGLPSGENAKRFKLQVASFARECTSILISDWNSVPDATKDEIWKSITAKWDMPNDKIVKKKTISYAGERWKAFKYSLTSRYLFDGENIDKSPMETYDFIDEDIWQEFIRTRAEPSFLEKRLNAQQTQAHNKYPHRLSQGGYELLEKKMMEEKLKERQEAAGDIEVPPPSPPQRHEKWKRARIKPSGEYTSEDTRVVAETIDSLVSDGFVQNGREDILVKALGQDEHPGRVRAVGRGVGIREYFGSKSHSTPSVISGAQLAALTKKITQDVLQTLRTQPNQNFPIYSPNTTQNVSTKDSCSTVPQTPDDEENIDIPEECELYVDGSNYVVAHANVYNLGPTIHNQVLANDMVRVAVTKVIDAKAQVPVPTDEVTTIAQAVNTFIKWPKRLLRVITNKDVDIPMKVDVPQKKSEPICQKLIVKAMYMEQDLKFKAKHSGIDIELPRDDIMDLCLGKKELHLTILQVWLTYLHRRCVELGKSGMYGFLDPYYTLDQNDRVSVQTYIQNTMDHNKKDLYLAPYFNNRHWQLLIINPKKREVTFLCSLGKKPSDKNLPVIVDSALEGYYKLQGSRRQSVSYESGYFVMLHMLNIISSGVVDSWMQIFADSTPFQKDEVKNVQERCANLILELIEANEDSL
ncbi:TNP1-like protein [Medicago truncatula]|uniref:TNP1-like protein n=1 Tax=Medicago truncatula TaxID=3880 RepID=A0A072V462_MEDTR|nr:TNP1-like protein [Medicago truncatula]